MLFDIDRVGANSQWTGNGPPKPRTRPVTIIWHDVDGARSKYEFESATVSALQEWLEMVLSDVRDYDAEGYEDYRGNDEDCGTLLLAYYEYCEADERGSFDVFIGESEYTALDLHCLSLEES